MRKYFKKDKKPKDEVAIEIKDEIKFEDIKDVFEEVDINGEEISPKKKEKGKENEDNKDDKKKRRHKKKHK